MDGRTIGKINPNRYPSRWDVTFMRPPSLVTLAGSSVGRQRRSEREEEKRKIPYRTRAGGDLTFFRSLMKISRISLRIVRKNEKEERRRKTATVGLRGRKTREEFRMKTEDRKNIGLGLMPHESSVERIQWGKYPISPETTSEKPCRPWCFGGERRETTGGRSRK